MKCKKKFLMLLVMLVGCCLSGCAFQTATAKEYSKESLIVIENLAPGRVVSVGASWYIGDADDSHEMDFVDYRLNKQESKDSYVFAIQKDEVSKDSDLNEFAMQLYVTDADHKTHELDTLRFPLKFGHDCFYEIRYEDGCYEINPTKGDEPQYYGKVNETRFSLGMKSLNDTIKENFSLRAGDRVEVSVAQVGGELSLYISGADGEQIYEGNNPQLGSFQVNISKDGIYTFAVKGKAAEGSVSFQILNEK